MQSLCSIKQAMHLNFTESVHAHFSGTSVRFWVVKIEKIYYTFFGCTCTWMRFSSHRCFLGPEHRWCADPIGIAPLFHLMLLFYYLVPRITVDKVFCLLVCYLRHTHTVLELELNDVLWPVYIYLYLASRFHSSKTTHYVWVSQKAFSCPEYTEPKHLGYKIRFCQSLCLLHGKMMVRCCFAEQQLWRWHWCLLVKDWNSNSMIHSHYSYWPVGFTLIHCLAASLQIICSYSVTHMYFL